MVVFSSSQFYCFYPSPLGQIRLIEIQECLSQADFVDDLQQAENISERFKESHSAFLLTVCQQLDEFFTGIRQKFNLRLKPQGTDFQCAAWNALLRVPYGETWSYLQHAKEIKNPKAVRAIGQANRRNPIPIIIPCHRVIGKNGELVGYAGGLGRKAQLLELERRFKHVQKN